MRIANLALASLTTALLMGCSTTGAPPLSTAVPPVDLPTESREFSLAWPDGGRGFSVAEQEVTAEPGPGQTAAGEAAADGNGSASAAITASNGADAHATFRLGQVVRNPLPDRQMSVCFVVECDSDHAAEVTPPPGIPEATVGLHLIVRNRRTRELTTLAMITASNYAGTAGGENHHRRFTERVILGPGDVCEAYLAGTVRVKTEPGREAEARLAVSNVRLMIEGEIAPPVAGGRP